MDQSGCQRRLIKLTSDLNLSSSVDLSNSAYAAIKVSNHLLSLSLYLLYTAVKSAQVAIVMNQMEIQIMEISECQ